MRSLILLLLAPCVYAANIPIACTSTQTQLVCTYTATTAAACTITATDNNGGPTVNDVDASKFTNANLDLSRTWANGYRWPTLVSGLTRTIFIGGHDEVKWGIDGRWYSTALQANSAHSFTVSCNSGADTGTIVVSTKNIPAASSYPEQVIPVAGAPFGGFAQPTRRPDQKRGEKIIDPISGLLLIGIEGPLDEYNSSITTGLFDFVYDSGSAWTNAANALTNQVAGTLATTTTVNAPLFLAPSAAQWGWYRTLYLTDFQTTPYGCSGNCNGTGSTVTLASCLTQDSGQTCATSEIDETVTNTAASVQGLIPATQFSGGLSAWAPFSAGSMWGGQDVQNLTLAVGVDYGGGGAFAGASASGSVVTITQPSLFNIKRVSGSKFEMFGCSVGANTTLTVSHVDSPLQITVQESGLALTNCSYRDRAFGLRVWLKTAGTLKLSETFTALLGNSANRGSNGEISMCAQNKVTDIAKDCAGATRSPAVAGYLCKLDNNNSGAIVLLQDDGQVCLQTALGTGAGIGYSPQFIPKEWLSNKSIIASQSFNNHIWSVTKDNSGDYTEYVAGTTFPRDKFSYVDLTAAGNATSIKQQIINLGGAPAAAMSSGLFSDPAYQDVSAGYTAYAYFAGGQNAICGLAFSDVATNTVIGAINTWDTYPMMGNGCHSAPQMLGGKNVYFPGGQNPVAFYGGNGNLGGPFVLQPSGIRKNGVWTNYPINITAATNANPGVFTATASDLDAWSGTNGGNFTGAFCSFGRISGGWGALSNATWHVQRIDNNTFNLRSTANVPLDTTTFGAYPGALACGVSQPLVDAPVAAVATNAADSNAAKITIGGDAGFVAYFPSGSPHFSDGDPVVFYSLSQTAQFYIKASCTGCDATHYDVFKDAALTIPALAGAPDNISNAVSGPVSYAEACPVLGTLTMPGPIYYDNLGGPSTGSTPYIRCVTMEFSGEPCSYWAGSAEASAYPCAVNTQTYTSQLQAIVPGMVIFDTSHVGFKHEHFLVLAKDTLSNPGKIRLTLMRWYGESTEAIWSAARTDLFGFNHSPGWTPMVSFVLPASLLDASNPTSWTAVNPALTDPHIDIAPGPGVGNVTLGSAWQQGTFDGILNTSLSTLSLPFTYKHNSTLVWNGDTSDTLTSISQNYPSCRHELTAPASEQAWCANWAAANIASGNPTNNADGTGVAVTLTAVGGTNYVFTVNNPDPSGTTNIKTMEYPVLAPAHMYAVDISSPTTGNVITDSTLNSKCYAYKNGECRAGSVAGTWYIAMSGVKPTTWGQILSNNMSLGSPVLYPAPPWAGWAIQTRISPNDLTASGVRRLTTGFGLPTTHYSFQAWRPSAPVATGGIWGFMPAMPFAATQVWRNETGTNWLLAKIPPWPARDSVNRTTYVPVRVYTGASGDTVRIAFGYGENGDPANGYCTSRAEKCWTVDPANYTTAAPFAFAVDTQHKTTCGANCFQDIPAISGRVLFYQIEINGVLDQIKVLAVP